jgi:2-oxoglutarate dehydrogenase E1 component
VSLIDAFRASSQLGGGNAAYIEELYESWLLDPISVASEWQKYFAEMKGREAGDRPHGPVIAAFEQMAKSPSRAVVQVVNDDQSEKQAAVFKLVHAHRARGHMGAQIDPLGMMAMPPAPDLEPSAHGLGAADMDKEYNTGSISAAPRMKLRDLIAWLRATYCASIGAEIMHIDDIDQRRWLHERLERAGGNFGLGIETRERILEKLTAAEGLERYLHTKYVGQKRFSLEGGDSFIPLMDAIIQRAGANGVKETVIAMAHRGRLNLLVNTLGKAPGKLFEEFEGKHEHIDDPAHSGDVKYHMGYSADVPTPGGPMHLALAFNPSHLEIANPVVVGSVRARQTRRRDHGRDQVLPITVHGDSAFAGQGVVMELFTMSQARGFAVGGTVHVVINNQVGFTTSRQDDTRSTFYCTDVAKMVSAPVFHVNADDPEAVFFVAELAFDYRKVFKRDVVIDLVCYRRHGHNEADEPAATQPLMYQNIRARKTTRELYAEKLAAQNLLPLVQSKAMTDAYRNKLDAGENVGESTKPDDGLPHIDWHHFHDSKGDETIETGVPASELSALALQLNTLPSTAKLHPRVAKVYEDRLKMGAGELRMDWGFAETLAYASLIRDGFKLRVVGQDSGRGTFFHRHALVHDQATGEALFPLQNLAAEPSMVAVVDSLLSEEAVMAFEYGYSTADPHTLVIWEGQFGDFANGAQVVIDQFISSGEAKWGRLCGMALFLPHGYEGQGPARLERFLQLCALNNMQVCTPTTPAQMFHMLRRQMVRNSRKPLVVMTPKSMLRNKLSTSTLEDLNKGSFQNLIPDSTAKAGKQVSRVVICGGKVYYDLIEDAEKRGIDNVAVVRVEQLYPFPRQDLINELKRFPAATDIVWCQEEPMNQGAWYQIAHHLRACLGHKQALHYAGRPRSPAPACGHFTTHIAEQAALTEQALISKLNGEHVHE